MMKITVKGKDRQVKLNIKEKIKDLNEINMKKCIKWGYTSIAPQRVLTEGIDMYLMGNGELWLSRKIMKEHPWLIIDQMIIERFFRDETEELNQVTYEASLVQFISRVYYDKDISFDESLTIVVDLHERRRQEKHRAVNE